VGSYGRLGAGVARPIFLNVYKASAFPFHYNGGCAGEGPQTELLGANELLGESGIGDVQTPEINSKVATVKGTAKVLLFALEIDIARGRLK